LGFWIGLTDIFHDGTWVWNHFGRPLNFSNWAPGEPNNLNGLQHCAALDLYVGGWTDVGCDSVRAEQYGSICEAAGSSMTYTKETGKKWENEFGKTSHMKVLMVHNEDDCGKECTATAPCIAFTFIPGMEICALKAPKDAATLVPAGGDMISGRLDGERPGVQLKALDSTICLPCLPVCNVEEGTKYSGHNLFPLGAETQEECAAACLREPECHFWTHNPNVGKCWLKKSDLGRAPSTKGSNSGQKSCGVTEDDIQSGDIIEDGCDCASKAEDCSLAEDTKYSGHNLYTTKGIKVGNMAGCAALCFEDSKCKFWTYNPRVSKCWMKTSDQGKSPSTKGSVSGQKACGAPGVLPDEPETKLPESGEMTSPNFPNDYPSGLHQRKTIQVAKGKVINIHFTDFEVEHPGQFDFVEITDGDGSRLGRFSADQNGNLPNVTSNTETVHVLFHSDEETAKRGWRLEWSASESTGERPTNGILSSTNYPDGNYLNNEDHTQTIRVPKGNTIRMEFLYFRLEDDPWNDYVTIIDGDGTELEKLTGWPPYSRWSREIISKTETVHVRFITDSSITSSGWQLSWRISGTLPTKGVLTSPGYPGRYPSNHDSTQTIQVSQGKGVKLHFTHLSVERPYDYVHIVDDDGHDVYLYEVPDEDMILLREIVDVVFHTDGSEQRSGWKVEWSEV